MRKQNKLTGETTLAKGKRRRFRKLRRLAFFAPTLAIASVLAYWFLHIAIVESDDKVKELVVLSAFLSAFVFISLFLVLGLVRTVKGVRGIFVLVDTHSPGFDDDIDLDDGD
jgi:hypothetical protein